MSPKVSDEHKETRSKAILDAARQVFSQKGYASTTMKDVVEESGMSRGNVYMYFPSTEAMMLALIAEEDAENTGQMDELVKTGDSIWSLFTRLIQSSEANITNMSSGFAAAIYEFYLAQWRINGNTPLLEQRYDKAKEALSNLLQLGIQSGEFNPHLPVDDIACFMISLMNGMTLDCTYLGPDRIKLRAQLEVSTKMLQALLQPQSCTHNPK